MKLNINRNSESTSDYFSNSNSPLIKGVSSPGKLSLIVIRFAELFKVSKIVDIGDSDIRRYTVELAEVDNKTGAINYELIEAYSTQRARNRKIKDLDINISNKFVTGCTYEPGELVEFGGG